METKIPTGYEGSWEQEIDITDKNESLAFHVTNRPLPEYKGRIRLKIQENLWKMRSLPYISGTVGKDFMKIIWVKKDF